MKMGTRRKPNNTNTPLFASFDIIYNENGEVQEPDQSSWPDNWKKAKNEADSKKASIPKETQSLMLILDTFTKVFPDLYPYTAEFKEDDEYKNQIKTAIEECKRIMKEQDPNLQLTDDYFEDSFDALCQATNRTQKISNMPIVTQTEKISMRKNEKENSKNKSTNNSEKSSEKNKKRSELQRPVATAIYSVK